MRVTARHAQRRNQQAFGQTLEATYGRTTKTISCKSLNFNLITRAFKLEAERLRQLHIQEYPDYKYKPRKKVKKNQPNGQHQFVPESLRNVKAQKRPLSMLQSNSAPAHLNSSFGHPFQNGPIDLAFTPNNPAFFAAPTFGLSPLDGQNGDFGLSPLGNRQSLIPCNMTAADGLLGKKI